jgi:hypothetical protein
MRLLNLFAFLVVFPVLSNAFECPQKPGPGVDVVEQAEDCPWAGAARLLGEKAEQGGELEPVFQEYVPGILKQLDADRASAALQLWGKSINYDELAGGVIVHPGILNFISAQVGVEPPNGKIMHAGAEHTYGYLFSLLPTKFGFKRARWVRPDIEQGLGLAKGDAGPDPAEGTLLSNITCLAGGIAFKDDAGSSELLKQVLPRCAGSIKVFVSKPPKFGRLSEEVQLSGDRKVTLRTDFIPFIKTRSGNSHLLIYSVYDSALHRAYLVTAFPVNEGFVKNATAPGGLGRNKSIQTRYNAFVEGLTGEGKFKGSRTYAAVE